MSLLWRTAAAYQIEAASKPRNYTAEIHPDELAQNPNIKFDRDRVMGHERWGPAVQALTESIKQHGYQPDMHGHVSLEIGKDGNHVGAPRVTNEGAAITGMKPMAHDIHANRALTYALQEAGHGPIPVHVTDHRPKPGTRQKYYHGTTAEGLDEIHPNNSSIGNFGPGTHHPGHAYLTPNKEDAWSYATRAADDKGGRPRVYEVKPTGPVEEDPMFQGEYHRGNFADDLRTKHPLQVVREHKPPKDIHNEYYADEPWESSR
jgi:rifampin ADP-ribosylating transferase